LALHILVVDDDVDVLPVLVEILQASGHVVSAADSGLAMREVLAGKRAVDAIVLDWTMPGEPSAELALHAKALKLPIVMISGSEEAMQFADEHSLQLLAKPFRMAELLDAINSAVASGEFGQRGG
jgi:DNA-binding response OmpR family regulator